MSHQKKILILVRHAHRDTDGNPRESDNGLSKKGRKQAEAVFESLQKKVAKYVGDVAVLSSPKKRCMETIAKIADFAEVTLVVSPLLDEESPGTENSVAFIKRIRKFLLWWKNEAPSLTLICSHGDWLPVCMELLVAEEILFEKAGWIEVIQDADGGIRIAKSSSG